ncbi:MAG: peroxiredoxin [Rugosibacter sp.]|nr:peroxiredoxin [Rugosibacter sp.]
MPSIAAKILIAGFTCLWLSQVAAEVPLAGTPAPTFSLPDQNGKLWRLDAQRGHWVVLYFYPKDDTPGCTQEACAFRDDLQALTELGAQVVGVSVDDTASHQAFAAKYHLPFPLLSDSDAAVARRYGALSDWRVVRFARRYTFLVDPEGKLAKTYLQVETSRHSKEIVDDLRQLTRRR